MFSPGINGNTPNTQDYRTLLVAKITSLNTPTSGPLAGRKVYEWTEQTLDPATGADMNLDNPRKGVYTSPTSFDNCILDLNDATLPIGEKVWARMKGAVSGITVYETCWWNGIVATSGSGDTPGNGTLGYFQIGPVVTHVYCSPTGGLVEVRETFLVTATIENGSIRFQTTGTTTGGGGTGGACTSPGEVYASGYVAMYLSGAGGGYYAIMNVTGAGVWTGTGAGSPPVATWTQTVVGGVWSLSRLYLGITAGPVTGTANCTTGIITYPGAAFGTVGDITVSP